MMSLVTVIKYKPALKAPEISAKEYRQILELGFKTLGQSGDIKTAVRKFIPRGRVGFKTNCLTGKFFPTPVALSEALAELLVSAGILPNQVIVWERTSRELKKAGYTLNASSNGTRCMGTDTNGIGYAGDFETSGEVNTRVSRIMTDMIDYNINLPILKDHSIAGLSGGMKNMYGAIFNPNKFHDGNCSPYAAEVSALETIRKKNRLTIIDAVRLQYNGGPGFMRDYLTNYGGLILSDDPVAADRVGLEIIRHYRKINGLPTLEAAGRDVRYLEQAQKIGLGTADIAQINLKVLQLDINGLVSEGSLL